MIQSRRLSRISVGYRRPNHQKNAAKQGAFSPSRRQSRRDQRRIAQRLMGHTPLEVRIMAFQEPKIENKTVASPFGTWELNLYPMDKDKKILRHPLKHT